MGFDTDGNTPEQEMQGFLQSSFLGGMRQDVEPSDLNDNEYYLLLNGRVRNGKPEPVKLPLLLGGLPAGIGQGLYAAGSLLIAFINGKAFFQDFGPNGNGAFELIPAVQMREDVNDIFLELVPASTVNFKRVSLGDTASGEIALTTSSSASPVCAVVQDGYSQPILVFPTGQARVAQTFNEWNITPVNNVDKREYVPVGKQMLYRDGVLYIASPDGREIYRSVRGRPLDFVIAINEDGDKLNDGLFAVEASRLAHKVDFDQITCLKSMNKDNSDPSAPAGFYVSTLKASFMVTPDNSSFFYGEDGFRNTDLFPVGALNNFSFIELLGDYALVSNTGIHSFNAVEQFRISGNNSPFSKSVHKLFKGITQTITAAARFDNYGVFAVTTVYGSGLLIYDTLIERFVALDIYPEVEAIKYLQTIYVGNEEKLFFMTAEGSVYQAYGSNATAECQFYPREWSTNNPEIELQLKRVRLVFQDITEEGVYSVTDFVDGLRGTEISSETLGINKTEQVPPITIPFGDATMDAVRNTTTVFQNSPRGMHVGILVKWNFSSQLSEVAGIAEQRQAQTSDEEAATYYGS